MLPPATTRIPAHSTHVKECMEQLREALQHNGEHLIAINSILSAEPGDIPTQGTPPANGKDCVWIALRQLNHYFNNFHQISNSYRAISPIADMDTDTASEEEMAAYLGRTVLPTCRSLDAHFSSGGGWKALLDAMADAIDSARNDTTLSPDTTEQLGNHLEGMRHQFGEVVKAQSFFVTHFAYIPELKAPDVPQRYIGR